MADITQRLSDVMNKSGVQIVFEPRPSAPAPYAGPIDVEVDKETIPVSPNVDVEKFLGGDDDPCQVVAKIPVSWSFNGYYFAESAVRKAMQQIAENGLTGTRGHVPSDENDPFRYPEINVAWVGAIYDDTRKAGYVRGYIDPAYPELKRHLRAGLVNRVSSDILVLEAQPTSDGGVAITDCIIRSLDFTPRLKNAYDQAVVAQDMINKPQEVVQKMEDENKEIANEEEKKDANPTPNPEPQPEATPTPEEEKKEPTELETLIASLGEDPVARIKGLLELEANEAKKAAEDLRGKVLQDMIKDTTVREVVSRLVPLNLAYGEAEYKAVLKDMIEDPALKRLFTARPADQTIKPTGVVDKKSLLISVSYKK